MGAGHVPRLGGTVLDPASDSAQVGGPRMLTQHKEGGSGLLAAEALVPCMFPQMAMAAVTHPRRVRDCRDCS